MKDPEYESRNSDSEWIIGEIDESPDFEFFTLEADEKTEEECVESWSITRVETGEQYEDTEFWNC